MGPVLALVAAASSVTTQVAQTPAQGFLSTLMSNVGPLGAAIFSGVFLGGIALSFFWKYFGPWQQLAETRKLLEEAQQSLDNCHAEKQALVDQVSQALRELEAMKAEQNIFRDAMQRAGLNVTLGPDRKES
jgi:hypothetical protein